MAINNDTATVSVVLNSEQARRELEQLQKDAKRFNAALEEAWRTGNKVAIRDNTKALNATNRALHTMRSNADAVASVMRDINKTAPKELRRALRVMKKDLSEMERGSDAWKEKAAQIAAVQKELSKVNRELNDQRSAWRKTTDWVNQWYYSLSSAFTWATKAVSGIESSIQAFADMDTAMADTQKFTGMSAEEVARLNEAFKQMDTRTSREDLNALAAAAGRLGKNSVEDVLGFVRAGDKIGVAMSELGADAPQIISQLAGVFGLEGSMGTEQAMLSVGSAINTLSQNCAASTPNLVDFASRLGAMASASGMTMDEMLAFGAVLDANRVSIEKGATAMQEVMNKMLADPAKFAKTAGLNVEAFTAALKRSSTEGLMMFVEALSKMDKEGVSRALTDLKVSGAGVTTTFITLANKVGDVRAQLLTAKEAFTSASSVGEEFSVQNDTVQARLDKARNALHELAVELGEQLSPMALTAMDGVSGLTKGLVSAIGFVGQHRAAFVGLAAAVAAYTVAVQASAIAQGVQTAALAVSRAAHGAWATAVAACKVVVSLFTSGVSGAKAAVEGLDTAMKKNVFGLIASAVAVAVTAIVGFVSKMKEEAAAAEAARKAHKGWADGLTDISKTSADYAGSEIARLKMLYAAATDEAQSRESRLAAAKKLQDLYPAYFGNMNEEDILLGRAKQGYEDLAAAIIQSARAKAAAAKIEENEKALLGLEETRDTQQTDYDRKSAAYLAAKMRREEARKHLDPLEDPRHPSQATKDYNAAVAAEDSAYKAWSAANVAIHKTKRDIRTVEASVDKLSKKYGVAATSDALGEPDGAGSQLSGFSETSDKGGKKKGKPGRPRKDDKFTKENTWAEAERLRNAMEYSSGEKDYAAYCARLEEIEKEFIDRKLQRTDLTTKERVDLMKRRIDMERKEEEHAEKEKERAEKQRVKEETERLKSEWADRQAELKRQYANGQLDDDAYKQALFAAEQAYLGKLKDVYAEGTKERADVERKIEDQLLEDKLAKRKAYVEAAKRIEDELNSGKLAKEQLDVSRTVLDKMVSDGKLTAREAEAMYEQMRLKASEALQGIRKEMESAAPATNKYVDTLLKYKKELADGLITEDEFDAAKGSAQRESQKDMLGDTFGGKMVGLASAWSSFMNVCQTDTEKWGEGIDGVLAKAGAGCEALSKVVGIGTSAMGGAIATASQFVQANAQIEQAAIESRYAKEIELAEGNSYKVRQLEKRRDAELSKSRSEASKKQFKMKIIEAVAQTAQNVIAAVGAGMQAGFPAALWMVPLLTGMAAAEGAVQIALLKKQQKAAEATGYSEGGFTRRGGKDEPAGIVHAGEWVASQRLVNSPVARPLIDALEWAQRTNTIGSLRMSDFAVGVPSAVGGGASAAGVSVGNDVVALRLVSALSRLSRRLDEPFVTVNTVVGDTGIKRAQDDYELMMRNKTPKSRWK